MYKLMKVKKIGQDNKGFTLIELIVVVVILAILAGVMIPSFVKVVDAAKEKRGLANARNGYTAAQIVGTEWNFSGRNIREHGDPLIVSYVDHINVWGWSESDVYTAVTSIVGNTGMKYKLSVEYEGNGQAILEYMYMDKESNKKFTYTGSTWEIEKITWDVDWENRDKHDFR